MELLKNKIGRPSNGFKKKKRIIKLVLSILVIVLIALIILLFRNIKINNLTGASNKLVKISKISLGVTHKGSIKKSVWIMEKPSSSSKRKIKLQEGVPVIILDHINSWYKVKYIKGDKSYVGYIGKSNCLLFIDKSIIAGHTYKLKPTMQPINYTEKFYYRSSNNDILRVDRYGRMKGIKEGIATIMVKTESGKYDYLKIRVNKRISTTKITVPSTIYTKVGSKITISKKIYPENSNDKYVWSSSNESIATVDSNGVVTAKAKGKVVVKIKSTSGKEASSTIYITDKDALSLNVKASYISDVYSNVKKNVYGKSVMGKPLEVYEISNVERPSNTIFIDFAVHGFEDEYSKDGKVLVSLANDLIEYYAKNSGKLKNYRIVIVPCANPDGTIDGKNNYRADKKGAFGRCTKNGIDINRDFKSFNGKESQALRDLLLSYKTDMKYYLNMHGWENSVLGDEFVAKTFINELDLKTNKTGSYGIKEGYIIGWVKNNIRNSKPALIEFSNSKNVSGDKVVNALNLLINN